MHCLLYSTLLCETHSDNTGPRQDVLRYGDLCMSVYIVIGTIEQEALQGIIQIKSN